MWLARSERGHGIGTAALRKLLDEAATAGARTVIAETTSTNPAALAALRHNDATLTPHRDGAHVHARMALGPDTAAPCGLSGTHPWPTAEPGLRMFRRGCRRHHDEGDTVAGPQLQPSVFGAACRSGQYRRKVRVLGE